MKPLKIIVTFLLLLIYSTGYSQQMESGNKEGAVNADGVREIGINLGTGFTVTINGTDTDQISYQYSFEGNRLAYERNFKRAEFNLDKRGSKALLTVRFPELDDMKDTGWVAQILNRDSYNFRIERQTLEISVPRAIAIRLQSRYSNVDVSNIERSVTIETRSGKVKADQLGGDLFIQNEYGNSTISDIRGNVELNSRSSSETTIKNVAGSVRANSFYSTMLLEDIQGDLDIQNRSGEMEVDRVQGTVTIQGDYTKIRLNDIPNDVNVESKSGSLIAQRLRTLRFSGEYTDVEASEITGTEGVDIKGRSSTITLKNVIGPAQISGEYLKIRLDEMSEEVRVSNRSGSVTGKNLYGSVGIDGEYTGVTLERYQGSKLRINNRSNDVSIHALGTLTEVDIRVVYGDVRLIMEEAYSGRLSLETRYGEISNNLRFSATDRDTDTRISSRNNNTKRISGTVGSDESNWIRIETQNGDIMIRQK